MATETAPSTESTRPPEKTSQETVLTAPKPNWPVLIGSSALILAIALWAIILPENAGSVIGAIVSWISANLGWYYILTATVVTAFVIFLALSRSGKVRLGPDHSRPHFSLFTWTAMLFAAGIGIDLMFFSVAEPVSQYYNPPTGPSQNIEALAKPLSGHFSTTGPSAGPCTRCWAALLPTSPIGGTCR